MLDTNFWNQQAKHKKQCGSFTAEYYNKILEGIIQRLKAEGNVLKVDLWNESVATERNVLGYFKDHEVYGCDIGKVQSKGAHKNIINLHAAQADIRHLPYKTGSFNAILDISTIDHVCEEDAGLVIKEYNRLLADDGILLLIYAQNQPFAAQYWDRQFEGMYLLNSTKIEQYLQGNFNVKDDRAIDLLHSIFGLPPYRFIEKSVGHAPRKIRELFCNALLMIEKSKAAILLRRYAGLRVNVAVKVRV